MNTTHITFETDEIIRIYLQDGEIKTCVFLVKNELDYTMIDCGLNAFTTQTQLIPALKRLQIPCSSIRKLLITHTHDDHVGGLESLLEHIPQVELFAHANIRNRQKPLVDGCFLDSLQAVYLPGHTSDCYGFLDTRTHALISGDAIQLWGIGNYGVNVENPTQYFHTHEKLLSMQIENIFSSHFYDFAGIRALGRKNSLAYIRESMQNYQDLIDFVGRTMSQAADAQEICQKFKLEHANYPRMQAYTIEQILNHLFR